MTRKTNTITYPFWMLEDLCPTEADILYHLEDWFKEKNHSFRQNYRDGTRYHKGQITKFTSQDRYRSTRWKRHYAKRVFAIRRAITEFGLLMYAQSEHKVKTWGLMNCPPSGGVWTAKNYPARPHLCHHMLCPWCYMRRYEYLKNACRLPETYTLQSPSSADTQCLGFGSFVNCTLFWAYQDWAPDVLTASNSLLYSPPEPWNTSGFDELTSACERYMKSKHPGQVSMRLHSPVIKLIQRDGVDVPVVGIMIAYVSAGSQTAETPQKIEHPQENLTLPGKVINIQRSENTEVGELLRAVQPFPLHALYSNPVDVPGFKTTTVGPQVTMSVLEAFKGKHAYRVTGRNRVRPVLQGSTSYKSSCSQQQCASSEESRTAVLRSREGGRLSLAI